MTIRKDCKFASTKGKITKIITGVCRRKNRLQRKTKNNCSYLSPDKRMILHEDISNPIIIPSLNFPIELMVFLCLPAHHFSATNKNNLHYGRLLIQTKLTGFWKLHTRSITVFKSISNYYLNVHIL